MKWYVYLCAIVLSGILLPAQAQEKSGPELFFLSLETYKADIENAESLAQVKEVYKTFEKEMSSQELGGLVMFTDAVKIAYVQRLSGFGDLSLLPVLMQIKNDGHRKELYEQLPKGWEEQADLSWPVFAGKVQEIAFIELLLHADKPKEALAFYQNVDEQEDMRQKNPFIIGELFFRNNLYEGAISSFGQIVRSGFADEETKELLLASWEAYHGETAGFEEYYLGLLDAIRQKKQGGLQQQVLNEQAPLFSLKDLNGKEMSLADLKGKVVFIDFWATWCGPCVAAFPIMQKIVDSYKGREDVVFLFINTFERGEDVSNRSDKISLFMEDRDLNFNVLLDEKNEGKFTVADNYQVRGVPAQFVIDKNGIIRFKTLGYDGSSDGLIQEVNLLIEKTQSFK